MRKAKIKIVIFGLILAFVCVFSTGSYARSITNPEGAKQYMKEAQKLITLGEDPLISVAVSRDPTGQYTVGPVKIRLEITAKNEIKSITVRTNKEDKTSGTPLEFNNNICEYSVTENGYWYFLIEDIIGNTYDQGVQVSNIDRTPPTDSKPTLYQTSDTQIKVKCNQTDNESKISSKQYRLVTDETGNTVLDGYDWKNALSFNGLQIGKTYYVQTKATNGAGLETISKVEKITMERGKVDEVPEELNSTPTIELSFSPETTIWTKEVVITAKVSDPKGIKSVTVKNNSTGESTVLSKTNNEGTEKTYTYTATENEVKYSFIAINQSDGKKTTTVTFFNIDNTPPTADAPTVTQGSKTDSIIITSNQKDNGSKIKNTYYRMKKDGGSYSDWKEIPSEVETSGKGKYVIQTKAVDRAGNETISAETTYDQTGSSPVNDNISSQVYSIDSSRKMIYRIPPETTKDEFIQKIDIEGAYGIVDADNKPTDDGYIKTGYKVRTANNNYYELSVIGDIAPNGKADIIDLTRLKDHYVGFQGKILVGIYLESGDITGEGEINVLDISNLRAIIVGTRTFDR